MSELKHYGIAGMKKGQRRYQNEDGSLTRAGEIRYLTGDERRAKTVEALDAYHKKNARTYKKLNKQTEEPVEETKSSSKSKKSSSKSTSTSTSTSAPTDTKVTATEHVKAQKQQVINPKDDVGVRQEKELGGVGASMMAQPNAAPANGADATNKDTMAQQQLSIMEQALNTANSYNIAHPNGPFMVLSTDGTVSYTKDKKVAQAAAENFSNTTIANQRKLLVHSELAHHGILGMKWGIRRFQNADGSLTPEGRERYGVGEKRKFSLPTANFLRKRQLKAEIKRRTKAEKKAEKKEAKKEKKLEDLSDDARKYRELSKKKLSDLSNEEIKWLKDRMQLENDAKNLAKVNASAGRQFVRAMGDKLVTELTNRAINKTADILITATLGAVEKNINKNIEKKLEDKYKPKEADDAKRYEELKKQDPSKMSDKDLQALNKRLVNEEQVGKRLNPKSDDSGSGNTTTTTTDSSSSSKSSGKDSSNKSSSNTSSNTSSATKPKMSDSERKAEFDKIANKYSTPSKSYSDYQKEQRQKFIKNYRKAQQEQERNDEFHKFVDDWSKNFSGQTVSDFLKGR